MPKGAFDRQPIVEHRQLELLVVVAAKMFVSHLKKQEINRMVMAQIRLSYAVEDLEAFEKKRAT